MSILGYPRKQQEVRATWVAVWGRKELRGLSHRMLNTHNRCVVGRVVGEEEIVYIPSPYLKY